MKVIFLDIDGVLIPSTSYFSGKKPTASPIMVDIVNAISDRCGAKVVMNTCHNTYLKDEGELESFIEKTKIKNVVGLTEYPNFMDGGRLLAIDKWCKDNDVKSWVALDDCPIDHENAIRVNSDYGLTAQNYRDATGILGDYDNFLVFI
jgi:hypothetical protein